MTLFVTTHKSLVLSGPEKKRVLGSTISETSRMSQL